MIMIFLLALSSPIAEVNAEAETIKDEIKNYMANEKKVEELILGNGTIVRLVLIMYPNYIRIFF